jgi:hypothetical protein
MLRNLSLKDDVSNKCKGKGEELMKFDIHGHLTQVQPRLYIEREREMCYGALQSKKIILF